MKQKNRKVIQEKIDQARPDPARKVSKFYRIEGSDFVLQVGRSGSKSWAFRYTLHKKTRVKGMGSASEVTFEEAKKIARRLRVMLDEGIDPLAERDERMRKSLNSDVDDRPESSMTFRECAEEFIETRKSDWSNKKHAVQWLSSLENHVFPKLGDIPIDKIDVNCVLSVISPIYESLNETAVRVRGRIERIIGYSMVRAYRPHGPNPAAWTDFLSEVFPRRAIVRDVKHHPALPHAEIPDFMRRLSAINTIAAPLMMRFMVLTAARTAEVRHATWGDVDLERRVWVIPKEKMKARRPHRVPLSDQAMQVLREVRETYTGPVSASAHIFPGQHPTKPMSDGALLQLFERMDLGQYTPHGTARSSFRQWVSDKTSFPREVAEAALAHRLEQTERAYQRSDLLEKRVDLMAAWGKYCCG